MNVRRSNRYAAAVFVIVVGVALVACTSSEPDASGTSAATQVVPSTPVATPVACTPSADPPVGQGEAWTRARAILPADLTLYRPTTLPSRFGQPVLWAACVEPDGVPQLTIVYRTGEEAVAFVLNGGHSSWGNTPGPPTSIEKVTVRGMAGSLYTLAGGIANQQQMPPYVALSWNEGGNTYQIKVSSALLSPGDIRQMAEDLVQVP